MSNEIGSVTSRRFSNDASGWLDTRARKSGLGGGEGPSPQPKPVAPITHCTSTRLPLRVKMPPKPFGAELAGAVKLQSKKRSPSVQPPCEEAPKVTPPRRVLIMLTTGCFLLGNAESPFSPV